jgi:hypothetical protein
VAAVRVSAHDDHSGGASTSCLSRRLGKVVVNVHVGKHAGYCAAIRLGFEVPATWLLPHKVPPENERFAPTAARYNRAFDLQAVGERVGYPMYMKPFHGGGWVNVYRIGNPAELQAAYDASGRELMHLQAGVEGYDIFTRGLAIGPQTMVTHYDPTRPLHLRYQVDHNFLTPGWATRSSPSAPASGRSSAGSSTPSR